ncbi:MAG: IS5 family transposase [Bacillota bacterium]|nr:IS5 family transposase [Bacillota bacterium]
MDSFISYVYTAYDRLAKLGDSLAKDNTLLDWGRFRPIAEELYDNKTERGGHPNIDCVLMIKILVLQQWYSLSDQRMERELANNISFINFLGYPETIPDSTTIWLFRERLTEKGKINAIWQELQMQLDAKGLVVEEGSIQDATFITADPGRSGNKPRGDEARTRRSKDGTWAKKGDEIHFGYKLHNKVDVEYGLIRTIETTTASVHDSQIDLSSEGERIYRDKGYFGASARGNSVTMYRATRGHPLSNWDRLRNLQISKIRAPGERPFSVIKTVFKAAHVFVTTVQRVNVKMVFTAIAYNLYQLRTLERASVA